MHQQITCGGGERGDVVGAKALTEGVGAERIERDAGTARQATADERKHYPAAGRGAGMMVFHRHMIIAMDSGTYQKLRVHDHHHYLLACVLAIVLALLTPCAAAAECAGDDGTAISLHADYGNGARYRGIRLLGSLRLSARSIDGLSVHGLSGLTWSASHQRLYAVSDLGFLLHMAPRFVDHILVNVSFCAAFPLRDADGSPLRGHWRDAEGLSLRAAGAATAEQLLISFEQHPRIERYSVDGRHLGSLQLPPELRELSRYASANRALEAVTETRRFGVITAPELPRRDQRTRTTPLLTLHGARWPFHTLDAEHSGLVGLETLPDDNLLVLERRYISPFHPLIIALSRVSLSTLPGRSAQQQELARFDTSQGWAMDNFESVARHEGNRYFMITDDNAHPLQHSLLVYFEIVDSNAPAAPAEIARPPLSKHRL